MKTIIQKPGFRTISFKSENAESFDEFDSFYLRFPYTIFCINKYNNRVFVACCDEQPNDGSFVYCMPLPNTYPSGYVCLGIEPDYSFANPSELVAYYWNSVFEGYGGWGGIRCLIGGIFKQFQMKYSLAWHPHYDGYTQHSYDTIKQALTCWQREKPYSLKYDFNDVDCNYKKYFLDEIFLNDVKPKSFFEFKNRCVYEFGENELNEFVDGGN